MTDSTVALIKQTDRTRPRGRRDYADPTWRPRGPLPAGADASVSRYMRQTRQFPLLQAEEEQRLVRAWREQGCRDAVDRLVKSHLRLVVKAAVQYRGYGLPLDDLISEGTVGMMRAVKGFDPDRGFRLSTYAQWWIRAAMQEFILHSRSLVKLGTTSAQKKLFFNLRRLKAEMRAIDGGELSPEQVAKIAAKLDVPEDDVIHMDRRLATPDASLNGPRSIDDPSEWQDHLADDADSQEDRLAERQELGHRRRLLRQALDHLSPRERTILSARRLSETPSSLEELSLRYRISRERVRQIEIRAVGKVQRLIKSEVGSKASA